MTSVIVLFTTVCVALVGAGVPQYDLSSLFLSDSEAAVRRVTRDADGHPNITCCGSGYNMPDQQKTDMLDCKSQYGYEMADLLAEKGSETKFTGPESYFGPSYRRVIHRYAKNLLNIETQKPSLKDLKEAEFCLSRTEIYLNGIEKPASGPPPTKDAMGEFKKKMACAGQCMGQKQGVLDSNNYVIVDKFTTSLASYVVDADLKDFAQESVKKCAEEANEKAKAMGEVEYNGTKCNVAGARAVLCSQVAMELNCPDNKKVKSVECDTKREHLKLMEQHADS